MRCLLLLYSFVPFDVASAWSHMRIEINRPMYTSFEC